MHDGLLATLANLVDHYNEQLELDIPNIAPLLNTTNDPRQQRSKLDLTATEKAQMVLFLRTLITSTFICGPHLARPTP